MSESAVEAADEGVMPAAGEGRLTDALLCLAEAHGQALEILLGERKPDHGAIKVNMCGRWAWQAKRETFHVELRDQCGGWYATPAQGIAWAELDRAVSDDPRLPGVRAWAAPFLADPTGWRVLTRPSELVPLSMHPDSVAADHSRAGWADRLTAWTTTIQILRDAAQRAGTHREPVQLDLLTYLEETAR